MLTTNGRAAKALICASLATLGAALSLRAQSSGLTIENKHTILLDPACHACRGTHADFKLRAVKGTQLALDYGEIKPADKPFGARIRLVLLDASGKAFSRPSLSANELAT